MAPLYGVARVRLSKEASMRLLRLGEMDGFPLAVPEQTTVDIADDANAWVAEPQVPAEWPDVVQIAFDFGLFRRRKPIIAKSGLSGHLAHAWAALLADVAGPGVQVLTEPDPSAPPISAPGPPGATT